VLGECLLPSSFTGTNHRISQATQVQSILLVDVLVEFSFCYFPHNSMQLDFLVRKVAKGGGNLVTV
jgi:hypothetical protein